MKVDNIQELNSLLGLKLPSWYGRIPLDGTVEFTEVDVRSHKLRNTEWYIALCAASGLSVRLVSPDAGSAKALSDRIKGNIEKIRELL